MARGKEELAKTHNRRWRTCSLLMGPGTLSDNVRVQRKVSGSAVGAAQDVSATWLYAVTYIAFVCVGCCLARALYGWARVIKTLPPKPKASPHRAKCLKPAMAALRLLALLQRDPRSHSTQPSLSTRKRSRASQLSMATCCNCSKCDRFFCSHA